MLAKHIVGNESQMIVFTQTMKKALPLIVCGLLFAGCCTSHQVTKWEYRMADTLPEVNQLADQGWIVVNFFMPAQGGPNQYLLKRPKP